MRVGSRFNSMFGLAAVMSTLLATAPVLSQEIRTGSAPVPPEVPRALTPTFASELARWAEENPQEGGTSLADWQYEIPAGVRIEQVTFYSNEHPTYAKIFYPAGFGPGGHWPAVVLGHGYNGISLGIEKYGAHFAERGLVAMVIDYRTYGFSAPWVRLLEPDHTRDGQRDVLTRADVELIRTRMHIGQQAEDFRNAIAYIQGEPGVDPERIGIWGSSQGAAVVFAVAAQDSRVRAVVGQIPPSIAGMGAAGPAAVAPPLAQDQVQIARTGVGGEFEGGFSFRTFIGNDANFWARELRPGRTLPRIPETTAVLMLPAEREELGNTRGPAGPFNSLTLFRGPVKLYEVPSISHFQAYGGLAFEVTANAAADWFVHYLK
jgi:uncharacterized protein